MSKADVMHKKMIDAQHEGQTIALATLDDLIPVVEVEVSIEDEK